MKYTFVIGTTSLLGNNLVRALFTNNIEVTALAHSTEKNCTVISGCVIKLGRGRFMPSEELSC